MGKTIRSNEKLIRSMIYMALLALVACTTGHCRRDGTKVARKDMAHPSGYEAPKSVSIKVAKPDGSTQCGFAPGLSLEKMAELQLSDINILSSEKKSDGLMHSASCGSTTGILNVYEISETDLEKVEKKGFNLFRR